MTLTLDNVLFTVFLATNLILGLLAGRRVKTLRDYSIGKKDFSTATITSTIIATWIGGGFLFFNLQNIYTGGLKSILVAFGGPLCLLFLGQVIAVRMGEFLNNLSVAEAMGELYGKAVRIITAISGILLGIGYTAIQFQVMSKALNIVFGVEGKAVIVTAASIVIIYSAFGGIRSVTITDIFQFITFSIFIPILTLIIWVNLKDPSQVIHTLNTNPIFNIRKTVGWNLPFIGSMALMLFYMVPGMHPCTLQRIAMAKDLQQVKKSNIYAAGIVFLMVIAIIWVTILLVADNPHLDSDKLVNYLVNQYAYPGLKGLIAVGIFALTMSTADSHLNASAVLAIHDIIKPLKPSLKESIISIRIFSFLIGVSALVLALHIKGLLTLILLGASMYMPIVTVSLLLAIFGVRSTSRSVLIGMSAGLITVIIWGKYFVYTGINNVIPGMIANLSFLVGSHYILEGKGAWVGIKDQGPLIAARQARRDAWKSFKNTLKRPRLYSYLERNLPAKESLYSLFGIYIIGATYASFFTVPEYIVAKYQKLYDIIAHSVLIGAFIFLTFPAWPPTVKKRWFITFIWPLGILYILFIVGSILVFMSSFHQVQVMIFMLNLVIAALLLSWPLVLGLSISGSILAYIIFYLVVRTIPLEGITSIDSSSKFSIIYGILLFSSFLIALIRFKQSKTNLEDRNTYLLTTQAATRDQLVQVLGYREELLKELNQEEIALFDNTTSAYIQQAIYRITDYLKLEVSEFSLDQLVEKVKASLKLQVLDPEPRLILKNHTQIKDIQADLLKIIELLVNSIIYIQQHNTTNNVILIGLEDSTLGHMVDHIEDYTRKLAALKLTITTDNELPLKQELYMVSPTQAANFQGASSPMLLDNLRIVDAHYGYTDIQFTHRHVYVIPVNVREVRGKVMELLREPAAVDLEELKHPLAIELEKKLLDRIKGTPVDLKVIQKALSIIKKYHGGVRRKSGEPFFTHPIQVALILMDYSNDQDAIVAALLHDTVEDTPLSLPHIGLMFGNKVASLVEKATNLEGKIRKSNLQEHEYNYRFMNDEADQAALVKLADRLHNMRTIKGHPSLYKQKHIANETLLFFVPMAKHLGMSAMNKELEELSLEVLSQ